MKVRIKDSESRQLLFNSLKEKYGITWKEIRAVFNVPKSTFEKYKNGLWAKDYFLTF